MFICSSLPPSAAPLQLLLELPDTQLLQLAGATSLRFEMEVLMLSRSMLFLAHVALCTGAVWVAHFRLSLPPLMSQLPAPSPLL